MTRFFDFILSTLGLLFLSPLFLLLFIIGLFDTGSPLFVQLRVGRNKKPFRLIKFRTMLVTTESVASHLVAGSSVTAYGKFLRSTKLDELPQLINVLIGDMSLVGPRPCLYNQFELIKSRDELGVFKARPGITGLSQISEIDMSTPELLACSDAKMLNDLTLSRYFYYIFKTLVGHGQGDRVR